jgi:hypothetical protein
LIPGSGCRNGGCEYVGYAETWKAKTRCALGVGKVERQLDAAHVSEPEKVLLGLLRKWDVGLSKESGVCCNIVKGLAVQYHIPGKFRVASIDKQDEIEEPKLKP